MIAFFQDDVVGVGNYLVHYMFVHWAPEESLERSRSESTSLVLRPLRVVRMIEIAVQAGVGVGREKCYLSMRMVFGMLRSRTELCMWSWRDRGSLK